MAFRFLDPGPLQDALLSLRVTERLPPAPGPDGVATYRFEMVVNQQHAGGLNLRIGHNVDLVMYRGHIGYRVDEHHRGHHYAERACRLVLPLAAAHGLQTVWITCNPENGASRRTCERLGAELVEIVTIPEWSEMYPSGAREKCRYRLSLPVTAKGGTLPGT